MYSHEIEQLLKIRNYLINSEEYLNIMKSSPQIDHVKYSSYTDEFETWTSDNYYWKYKVYIKDKKN
jgi:hypothetical protein